MNLKKYVIALVYVFMFSAQAEVRKEMSAFDNSFSSDILSGEEGKIERTIDSWIAFLMEGENGKEHYPSLLEKDRDVSRFRLLLREAKKKKTDTVLINIAGIYFSSAEKTYGQLFRHSPIYPTRNFSSLYDLSLFLDYSLEEQRVVTMMREWYIGLVFLSFVGFSSSEGKELYVSIIERVQKVYDFLFTISHYTKPLSHGVYRNSFHKSSPRRSVVVSQLFESFIKFDDTLKKMRDIYFRFILPSFTELSWVKHDVLSGSPEVLFTYGRILYKAYGSKNKGLSYISLSADLGYLPAMRYLGEHYLRQGNGVHYQTGERLMMEYLGNRSLGFLEKFTIIHELVRLNAEKGKNIVDSFQKGVSSLKRSCLAAFRNY